MVVVEDTGVVGFDSSCYSPFLFFSYCVTMDLIHTMQTELRNVEPD